MPTNDIDILEEMAFPRLPITNKPSTATITVENNTGTYSGVATEENDSCTQTSLRGDEPEYEVVGLTWRQKFALKRIIWKAWLKRALGLDG
jgi:hypothetical protein